MAISVRPPVAYPIRYSPSTKSVRISKNLTLNSRSFRARLSTGDEFNVEEEQMRSLNANKHLLMETINSTELRASPAEVEEYSRRYRGEEYVNPRLNPPDFESFLFDKRCISITMPLVPEYVQLLMVQLVYLQMYHYKEPVQIGINCPGTRTADGQTVGYDSDGFAIYDLLMQLKSRCKVYTINLGLAIGPACLILAAGDKGRRFSYGNAFATLQQPRIHPTQMMPTTNLLGHTKRILDERDMYVKLIAKHTGQSIETVATKSRKPYVMDAVAARDFGVIDKIIGKTKTQQLRTKKAEKMLKSRKMDPATYGLKGRSD